MKNILIFAALAGVIGTASAFGGSGAEPFGDQFSDLTKATASDLKAAADGASGIPVASRGYIEPADPAALIEWVGIPGGKFIMGTNSMESGFGASKPAHEVAIKTFYMSKTEVTVAQYAECVNQGKCTKPLPWYSTTLCNWGAKDRQLHPVNCVTWEQAKQYAKFKGARLPSESEWEYAATSGGGNRKYPWGNDEPSCEKAVMLGNGGACADHATMPACSRPAGNTGQGLCDMAGNVWEWVEDTYKDSYNGAPSNGRAVEGSGPWRVIRGGAYNSGGKVLRVDYRGSYDSDLQFGNIGFRIVKAGHFWR